MSINAKLITKYLGSQTRFVSSRTDNLHVAKKKDNKYVLHNSDQIETVINNNEHYQNAKIAARSAPDGFCWLVLDYDDKQETGKVPDMASPFSLDPTFTVKTPTGAGKQEWYLIKEEQAKQLPNSKYSIPNFESVEIFVAHKDSKQLFVSPGSKKNNIEYELSYATQPVEISNNLFQTLKTIANHDKQKYSDIINTHAHRFNAEVDTQQNKIEYLSWLNQKILPYELGDTPLSIGRDNLIYNYACQGFTYNLSWQTVKELIMSKIVLNAKVISDPNGEFGEDTVDIKINSAYKTIHSEEREQERVKTQELELFEQNEFGYLTVTREQYTKKALYLSKFTTSKIMSTPQLLEMFSELIVQDQNNNFYVPKIISRKHYEELYKRSIERETQFNEKINVQDLLTKLADTTLHWEIMSSTQFKDTYKIPSGSRRKPLESLPKFAELSNTCHVYPSNINSSILIEDGCFYPETKSPIEPAKNVTKEERATVNSLFKTHISRIVNPKYYEEESSWLLDRYAMLLQNPTAKIDNAIIFKGGQGSGKTSLIEIFMLLFPRADTNVLLSVDDIENRFMQWTRVMHIDDVNINLQNKTINKLKSTVTAGRIPNEVKFKNRTINDGTVNISISTNDEIHDREVITGRRWTIFINDSLFNTEQVQKDVRNLFMKLKENDWRLFRVFHTMLLERDTSNFRSDYKTHAHLELISQIHKGNEFTKAIANMIANYGYIAPDTPVFIPNKPTNRNDINAALFNHYLLLDTEDYTPNIESLKAIPNFKIFHHFAETREERAQIKYVYDETFVDPKDKNIKSRINTSIPSTNKNIIPPIQKWIELLAVCKMGNRNPDTVKHIIRKFEFHKQWEWDNKTKPNIANLGSINVYDHIDLDEDENDGEW